MTLIHYSTEPLVRVYSVGQHASKFGRETPLHKPNGLWLSADGEDDWPSFCRYNWSSWFDDIKHATEVVLNDDGILHITTDEELFALSAKYPPLKSDTYFRAPDWRKIAMDYDGIIIAPYRWNCRLNERANWYYTWDAASACIWNSRAIRQLVPRPDKLAEALGRATSQDEAAS